MSRLLVAALLLPVSGLAAPGVKDKPVYYFPTREGDTRVFASTTGAGEQYLTEVVLKVEPAGDGVRVTVGRTIGDRPAGQTPVAQAPIAVSARGVFRLPRKDGGDPIPLLRLPARAGDKWTRTVSGATLTYTVIGEEEIEVPAGKFKALRIEQTSDRPAETGKTIEWHAPGVGRVKQVVESIKRTEVLKSFTPGK